MARPQRDQEHLHLGLGPERRPGDQLAEVLCGEDRIEDSQGGEADPPVAQRLREIGKPAERPHGPDAPRRSPFAQVEDAEAVVPERAVARFQPGLAPVELLQVEEELDLDRPLVAGELREAAGEGGGVEQCRCDGVHAFTSGDVLHW